MKKLANKINHDVGQTLVGVTAGGIIWAQVDLDKLAQFDHGQLALVVFGGLVGLLGWLTNRGGNNGDKTNNTNETN